MINKLIAVTIATIKKPSMPPMFKLPLIQKLVNPSKKEAGSGVNQISNFFNLLLGYRLEIPLTLSKSAMVGQ